MEDGAGRGTDHQAPIPQTPKVWAGQDRSPSPSRFAPHLIASSKAGESHDVSTPYTDVMNDSGGKFCPDIRPRPASEQRAKVGVLVEQAGPALELVRRCQYAPD